MTDLSKKFAVPSPHSALVGHNARRVSEVEQLSVKRLRSGDLAGHECLPTTGKDLPAEIDSAILKLARVLARQAAREDHARQQAGSACHDEARGNLREIFHRPAE
ncbi:hypothetical protein [Pelagibacterium lentulum]|uniref:hypothetical protein n=1 Tax=Pelagibacterium lentulum TaxID=2029865 RepID=UPI000F8D8D9D|nr:hypothetical protein [Pelagibacterium lentulum]